MIGDCDTGVQDTGGLSGMIAACIEAAGNHGAYVSCVADVTNQLKAAGDITGKEKGRIQFCVNSDEGNL